MNFQHAYAVFTCRLTMELFRATKEQFGSYVPVERTRRVNVRTKEVTVKEDPVMLGYIFVPAALAPEFRRKAAEKYMVKQCFTPLGQLPWLVERDELYAMQRVLNGEFAGHPTEAPVEEPVVIDEVPRPVFSRGQKVRVAGLALLEGQVGTVEKMRSDGRIRLKFEGGPLSYGDVDGRFLVSHNDKIVA